MSDPGLDTTCDILDLIQRHFHCSSTAAHGLVVHGHVSIDGYAITAKDVRRWTRRQLYGRTLKAGMGREARILGSRLVRDLEQLKLNGL